MLILLSLFLISFSPVLYSMEESQKNISFFFSPNNVYIYREKINIAKKSNNCLAMAELVELCLPPDVIKKYIAPCLTKSLSAKYKHRLINYKICNNLFKETMINYNNNDEKWTKFSRHDDTYSIVPKINNNYVLWDKKLNKTLSLEFEKKLYNCLLWSQNTTEKKSYFLATRDGSNNKKLIFGTNNNSHGKLKLPNFVSHYCFSNDCTFLTIGFKENEDQSELQRFNITTLNGRSFILPGTIDGICSAHHSPLCAVINNNTNDTQTPHRVLFMSPNERITFITFQLPITSAKFNPDDNRFLTSSYNEITHTCHLQLWNIADLTNISRLHEVHYNNDEHILKVLFINHGKQIMTIEKSGQSHLFNGLTGKLIEKHNHDWCYYDSTEPQEDAPLCVWSNKHQLFINTFTNNIRIKKSTTGEHLANKIKLSQTPVGIGLTADENTIIFIDEKENAYQLPLYDLQEHEEIDFIETKANTIQLYEMWNIYNQNKKDNKPKFAEKIKSYIQQQQQKKLS